MRRNVLTVGASVLALGAVLALTNCQNQSADKTDDTSSAMAQNTATNADPKVHGKYLVNLGGCNDCHSPKKMTDQGPVPDDSRLLSGQPSDLPALDAPTMLSPTGWMAACNGHMTAWAGPWGISYAANLTPDTATGLGAWTPDIFVATLRTGKHMGSGRNILPPMPWNFYSTLTDDDLKSIFAYLQSLPPVHNQVPQPVPPAAAPAQGGSTN